MTWSRNELEDIVDALSSMETELLLDIDDAPRHRDGLTASDQRRLAELVRVELVRIDDEGYAHLTTKGEAAVAEVRDQ